RAGAFSAYVPLDSMDALGGGAGVSALVLGYKPILNVGLVTSQGAKVMRADVANAGGITGTGATVGVMSDSFDKSPTSFTTIRAANDIASGDLPVMKLVIDDLSGSTTLTDEGRAMTQIVHDVAPGAGLCFATANGGQSAFANNIRALRTNPACNA